MLGRRFEGEPEFREDLPLYIRRGGSVSAEIAGIFGDALCPRGSVAGPADWDMGAEQAAGEYSERDRFGRSHGDGICDPGPI